MKISVVIPTYNRRTELKRAVTSILRQSYSDFEIIVVDDASTDDTFTYFNNGGLYANDTRVRYVSLPVNQGVHIARNHGIASATGDFIIFLDSDDELLTEAIELAVGKVLEDVSVDFVMGSFRTDKGECTGLCVTESQYVDFNKLLCGKSFCQHKTCFVMLRTTVAKQYKYSAPNLDFLFFRYVAKKSRKIFYIVDQMGIYYTETAGATQTQARRVPNIQKSILRGGALEKFVYDFESDFSQNCPTIICHYTYGATLGLLLDWKQVRAVRMSWRMVRSSMKTQYIFLFLLSILPLAPLVLRCLFKIKSWIYKKTANE